MTRQLESSIQAAILRWLRSQPDCYPVKFQAGAFTERGIPDVITSVGDRILWLEVKRSNGRVSKIQAVKHARIRRAGAPCHVVRSLDEVVEIVERIRAGIREEISAEK